MLELGTFIFISIILVYISRGSLTRPRSHGFYRFFAWECIAGLLVLNLQVWFSNPVAWHQLLSWLLLATCLVPLAFGVQGLVTRGRPAARRPGEPQLLAFEKTSTLVTGGVYAYIRHPLYCSLLLLAWGIFFKAPGWSGLALALAASLFLWATALADEAECARFFGPDYLAYKKRTRMFLPFVF